jgi:hypothetical protein
LYWVDEILLGKEREHRGWAAALEGINSREANVNDLVGHLAGVEEQGGHGDVAVLDRVKEVIVLGAVGLKACANLLQEAGINRREPVALDKLLEQVGGVDAGATLDPVGNERVELEKG